MQRRTAVWPAPDELVELMGDVSGNELNGWGETEDRQPTLVMWANPAKIAHGPVQVRMTEEFVAHRELRSVLRLDDRHTPAPISSERTVRSPADWVHELTDFATSDLGHNVELVAVTKPRTEWFFEGRTSEMPWIILLAIAMDHAELATAPEHTSAIEVHRQYNRGTAAARALADWIRMQGFGAAAGGLNASKSGFSTSTARSTSRVLRGHATGLRTLELIRTCCFISRSRPVQTWRRWPLP